MTQNSVVRKGNWKIGKECDLSRRFMLPRVNLSPSYEMLPEPATTPLKQRSSVVFPAPLTPRTASICPGSIVNETPSSARTPPYRFESELDRYSHIDAESNVSRRELQPEAEIRVERNLRIPISAFPR